MTEHRIQFVVLFALLMFAYLQLNERLNVVMLRLQFLQVDMARAR